MFFTPTYIGALLAGAAFWCGFLSRFTNWKNPASKTLAENQPVLRVD